MAECGLQRGATQLALAVGIWLETSAYVADFGCAPLGRCGGPSQATARRGRSAQRVGRPGPLSRRGAGTRVRQRAQRVPCLVGGFDLLSDQRTGKNARHHLLWRHGGGRPQDLERMTDDAYLAAEARAQVDIDRRRPGVLAAEAVERPEAALAQFSEVAASLPIRGSEAGKGRSS